MKKLMVALSAVALAFGVHAAESWATGTGFEGVITPPVPLAENQSVGELETAASWSIPTLGADESLTITAGDTGLAGDAVPEKFSQTTSLNYLDIHTKLDNPVTRNINADGDPQDITANGIYFDSLVKITACDEVPDAQTDAKLMVYALENENTGATNLFIRAGQIQTDGTVAATDYDCGEFTYAGQWVRLTIKAIDDIVAGDDVCPGFVVFFGGNNASGVNPKTCSTSKNLSTTIKFTAAATAFGNALFPAYVASLSGAANSKLTGVAFAGQGAVDDIVFNDAAPFQQAEDKQFATLAWADGVTGFTCSYDSVDYSKSGLTGAGSVDIVFNPDITSLEVTGITYADGKFGDSSKTFDPIAADQTYTLTVKTANVTIGDQKFETFAEAITYINGTASGDLVVNFAAGFEPEAFSTTITPGADVTSLTIDLAGQTLPYTGETGYAISSAVPLTITDSVVPSTGMIVATSGSADGVVRQNAGLLTIEGGKFEGVVSAYSKGGATSLVSGGTFKDSTDYEGEFPLDCAPGFQPTLKDGYWTVAEIPTFTVTWDDSDANATAEATVDGDEINPGDAFPANTVVEFTVTPDEDFEYATEPTDWKLEEDGTITKTVTVVDQNLTVEIPVATVKTYAVTWDDTDANAKAVAKVYGLPIENGQKFARKTDVAFTVTPDENYEYATAPEGWTLEEDGTITQIFTVEDEALDVEIPAATEKQGGWDPVADPTVTAASKGITGELSVVSFAALSAWAQANDVTFAAGNMDAYKNAFLLNCAPGKVADEAAAFKITAMTQESDGSWTVTAVEENTDGEAYNGQVVIKGSETLEDAEWAASNVEGPFFKAFLEVKPAPVAD